MYSFVLVRDIYKRPNSKIYGRLEILFLSICAGNIYFVQLSEHQLSNWHCTGTNITRLVSAHQIRKPDQFNHGINRSYCVFTVSHGNNSM